MPNYLIVIIFAILMLPGVAGVILPILPGIPYMFLLALTYGFVDGFIHLTGYNLLVLGIITLLSFLVDYFSGIIGAKYGGAGKRSVVFGMIGFVAGLLVFPPFGGFLGLFLGVLAAELYFFNDHKKALKAATGGLLGVAGGMLANLLLGIIFLVIFVVSALS